MRADVLWRLGASGAGVRIAILDTGVASSRIDAFGRGRIRERLNFCPGASLDDGVRNGTPPGILNTRYYPVRVLLLFQAYSLLLLL